MVDRSSPLDRSSSSRVPLTLSSAHRPRLIPIVSVCRQSRPLPGENVEVSRLILSAELASDGCFFSLVGYFVIDHEIVVVDGSVDTDPAKREILKFHPAPPAHGSSASLRSHSPAQDPELNSCFPYPRCLAKMRANTTSTCWERFALLERETRSWSTTPICLLCVGMSQAPPVGKNGTEVSMAAVLREASLLPTHLGARRAARNNYFLKFVHASLHKKSEPSREGSQITIPIHQKITIRGVS